LTPEVESKRIAALPRGSKHHRSTAKLTEQQAAQIYRMSGSQRAIAKRFGVCQQLVSRIKRGEYWKHIHADA
jgi:hypothetical protein